MPCLTGCFEAGRAPLGGDGAPSGKTRKSRTFFWTAEDLLNDVVLRGGRGVVPVGRCSCFVPAEDEIEGDKFAPLYLEEVSLYFR